MRTVSPLPTGKKVTLWVVGIVVSSSFVDVAVRELCVGQQHFFSLDRV
jgi:hypothetical protein